MDSEQPVLKPVPPPEAALIKTGRLASGLGIADAVALLEKRGIHLSVSRWSQIENGYQTKGGRYLPVAGGAGQIAHMASVSGITPAELAESRPDAARVLAEVLRRQEGGQAAPPKTGTADSGTAAASSDEVAVMLPRIVAENWDSNPHVRVLWGMDLPVQSRLDLIRQLPGLKGNGGQLRSSG